MRHLYSSVVKVTTLELAPTSTGRMKMMRVPVPGLERVRCRLDLQFLRPGRDTPPAINAGTIPDREGIMFCDYSPKLMAGMQVETIPDSRGKQVVKGVFEIKEIPDVALDFAGQHHIEVKVVESVQKEARVVEFPENVVRPDTATNQGGVAYPDVRDTL